MNLSCIFQMQVGWNSGFRDWWYKWQFFTSAEKSKKWRFLNIIGQWNSFPSGFQSLTAMPLLSLPHAKCHGAWGLFLSAMASPQWLLYSNLCVSWVICCLCNRMPSKETSKTLKRQWLLIFIIHKALIFIVIIVSSLFPPSFVERHLF